MKSNQIKTFSIKREFILKRRIGEGSYGVVYDAFDPEFGQDVAVKVLRSEYVHDADIRNRFAEEAATAAAIDHSSGLSVYGSGTGEDGVLFYAMKKVRGKTLESLFKERGNKISDQEWLFRLLRIFLHVCEGVAAAHRRGIVHRDLKPENFIVDSHDFVTVLDWGLARRISSPGDNVPASRTLTGAVMGSPGYMSPEQARGDSAKADTRTDVFSLGIILYRILTAIEPFTGETQREAILSAIYREPQDPRRLNPWISRRLAAVCRKAIEKNPDNRYADADDLAKDLQAYLDGRDVSVARLSLRERLRGWARRKPGRALATASAVAVLLLAVFIVGGQIWLDENMVEKSFENIAQLDAENDSIAERLKTLSGPQKTVDQKETIEHERQMLRIRHFLNSYEILVMLEDIIRLRYIRTGPETAAALKSRLFSGVRQAVEMGEPAIAKTLILMARDYRQRRGWPVRLSPAEFERLDEMEGKVDAAILEEIENSHK